MLLEDRLTPAIFTFYLWWLALFLSLQRCSVNVCGMDAKWHTEMSKMYYITASCLPTYSKLWMILNAVLSPQGVTRNEPQGAGCCYKAQCELTEHLPGETGTSWESKKYLKWA